MGCIHLLMHKILENAFSVHVLLIFPFGNIIVVSSSNLGSACAFQPLWSLLMRRRGSTKGIKANHYFPEGRISQNFFYTLCMASKRTSKKLGGKNMEIPQQYLDMKKVIIHYIMGVSIQPHHQK